NYYGFYSGSFYPREYLHSGYLLVKQVTHYGENTRRMALAQEFVRGSAHSLLRNIAYYSNRKGGVEEKEPAGEIGTEAPANSGQPEDPVTEAAIDATVEAVDSSAASETASGDEESDLFAAAVTF